MTSGSSGEGTLDVIVDLHVHTKAGSDDSIIAAEDIVRLAKKAGLEGICITEHGYRKSQIAERLARENNFPVFGGMEASTELGDILVFGIDSYPRTISRAIDLKQFVEKAGGVLIAAHPFRGDFIPRLALRSNPSLTIEEACKRQLFQLVNAMEVANGWSTEQEAHFCVEVSKRLRLGGTGGSDAHLPWQIGCCVTVFENIITDERELVAELKRGRFRAEDRRLPEQKKPTYWISESAKNAAR